MKLCMKQKVISWGDKFTVTDETGEVLYTVEGEIPAFAHKLHIYGPRGDEMAFVHKKLFSLRPRYFVTVDGQEVAEVVKEISLLHPRYVVNGPDWEATGDILGHNYEITRGDEPIAAVHRKWMSWGDTYEISVADEANEVLTLAVVLTIDAVIADTDAAQAAADTTTSST